MLNSLIIRASNAVYRFKLLIGLDRPYVPDPVEEAETLAALKALSERGISLREAVELASPSSTPLLTGLKSERRNYDEWKTDSAP